jgi:phage-related baseplate assembly protein
MTTLAELVTPLTKDQVQAAIYAGIAAQGTQTTTWKPGAIVRTMIYAVSVVLAAFSSLQATIANSGFLDLAERVWLTLLARYVYNVERDVGSFATGTITANNAGGGTYSGDPGDIIAVNPTTGKSYRNTEAFSIGSMQTGVVIPMQAVEIGTPSSSAAGAINTLETPLLGVTITNPAAFVGTDEETDVSLRQRCREKTGSLSPNGPRDAYLFVAKSAKRADGSSIGVTRARAIPDGYGAIDLYLATASGAVSGTVGDLGTDLGRVDDAMQRASTPLSVELRTHSATTVTVPITYAARITDKTGKTVAEHEADVAARLAAYFPTLAIGGAIIPPDDGAVLVDGIKGEIAIALGGVLTLDVTLPAADVELTTSQVPILGLITPTITVVPTNPGS